jgi:DNA-binding XRE family transcriptional regulator
MSEEIFVDIAGYEGKYQISNYGNVKSLLRRCLNGNDKTITVKYKPRLLKLATTHGYKYVFLCKDAKVKASRVHRLVASAFIDNPNKLPFVNHKDGNKTNNFFENLEWVTASENSLHKTRVLGKGRFETHQKRKLDWLRVNEIRLDKTLSQKKLGEKYGVSKGCIAAIKYNKTWDESLK